MRAEIDLHNSELAGLYTDTGQHQLGEDKQEGGVQILPGMYAYGKVVIERPKVLALPNAALVHRGERVLYWTCENGHAVRTEVQTGVTDGEWVEVTSRQPASATANDADGWLPIDGTESVILGDLSTLSDGVAVTVSTEEKKETVKTATPAATDPKR